MTNHGRLLTREGLCRAGCTLAVVAAVLAVNAAANAESSPRALEYRVKAGFLYTFAKYVEWPAGVFDSPTNAVVIGVLGKDPFGEILDATVAGKTIEGRSIHIERFRGTEEIKVCHVLFISASEKEHLTDIQARLRGRHILTASDLDRFLQQRGQICFVSDDTGVKFDINLEATRQAGLRLDANLLRVARQVIRKAGPAETD